MSRRKSDGLLDDLFDELYAGFQRTPAWVGPVVALLALVVGGAIARPLGVAFAGVVLVAWCAGELQKRTDRARLDRQTGLSSIRNMHWKEFERLVVEAYRREGYYVDPRGGSAGDGGVDLILHRGDEQTLVQCKHWKTWRVGVSIVRELYGVMTAAGAARGQVVTSGRFTKGARTFAEGKPIQLVDGARLWQLIEAVQSAPQADVERTTPGPSTDDSAEPPSCPRCGAEMVERTARKGQHAGSKFWGCSTWPECSGIVDMEKGHTRRRNTGA